MAERARRRTGWLRWLPWPRFRRAVFDPHVFGVATQMDRPGVISGADEVSRLTGLPGPPRAYDVTCPGCGHFVACVPQDR